MSLAKYSVSAKEGKVICVCVCASLLVYSTNRCPVRTYFASILPFSSARLDIHAKHRKKRGPLSDPGYLPITAIVTRRVLLGATPSPAGGSDRPTPNLCLIAPFCSSSRVIRPPFFQSPVSRWTYSGSSYKGCWTGRSTDHDIAPLAKSTFFGRTRDSLPIAAKKNEKMASTIPRPFTVRIPAFYPPSGSLKRARASSSTFQTGTSTPASFSSTSLRTTTMTDATSDDEVVVLDGPPPQTLAQRVGGSSEPVSKKPKVEAIVIDDDDDEEEEASDEGKDDGDDYEQPDEEDDETEDDDDTVVDEIVSALVGSKPGVIRPGREVGGKKLRDRPHTLYAPVRSHTKKRKPSKPSPKVVLKLGPNPSSASDEAHREALAASEALDLKRRAFFRKHRPAFLALLPEQNNRAFLNLLEKPLVTASSSSKTDGIVPVAPFQMLPQPKGIKGSMHNYQLHGFSFLVNLVHSNGVNAILADEMGLGKTLQTIALLVHINSLSPSTNAVQIPKTKGHVTARKVHLIICPLSVLSAWMTEVNRWSSLKAVRFHGEKKERDRLKGVLKEELGTIDIVLTTCASTLPSASGHHKVDPSAPQTKLTLPKRAGSRAVLGAPASLTKVTGSRTPIP